MSLIKPAGSIVETGGQILRYAIVGKGLSVSQTVSVSEAFRRDALLTLQALTGSRQSFRLSGHQPDGTPDAKHRHAYYLPRPDSSGRIRELLVVSPYERFSPEEHAALRNVREIHLDGPSTTMRVDLLDDDDSASAQLASRWVSLTPFVPIRRFWGTHGKHGLVPEKQLAAEIQRALPSSVLKGVKLTPHRGIRVRVAPNSKTKLPFSPTRRMGYVAEFEVREPVCAPIALGHSSHFGLGQFVPKAALPREGLWPCYFR